MKKGLIGAVVALAVAGQGMAADIPNCEETLTFMERVADWQLKNPSKHHPLDWTQGAYYAGMMTLGDIAADGKYRDAMMAVGQKNGWKFRWDTYHADDHTVGQMYAEMYRIYGDPAMLRPQMACFNKIIANPAKDVAADQIVGNRRAPMRYWWCDALFMAPPALARLTAFTGDTKYLDYAVSEWKAASEKLYNETDKLFFRDNRYYPEKKVEKNGRNIYWSRGNGWVLGGLARMLQVMPLNHPDRPWFENQFKEMSAMLIKIQPADGAWRASLLDTENFKMPEASGTGFFVYGLAWGYNQGLLGEDAKDAALKGWQALCSFVKDDGKLTHVQVIAADPTFSVKEDSTEVYGVGAFLAAGSEIYRMACFERKEHVNITVKNDTDRFVGRTVVAVPLHKVKAALPSFSEKTGAVMDGAASRWIDTKIVDGQLLLPVDMLPGGEYTFTVYSKVNPELTPKPVFFSPANLTVTVSGK